MWSEQKTATKDEQGRGQLHKLEYKKKLDVVTDKTLDTVMIDKVQTTRVPS
jgi:hypothetical protein